MTRKIFITLFLVFGTLLLAAQSENNFVSADEMNAIFNEIKTPFKYGLVLVPADDSRKADCPVLFRKGGTWYMTYIVFDGRGYETWLAKSRDLLNWETSGRIMSFSDTSRWDSNQAAGYPGLYDTRWGGSYKLRKYSSKYWLSYLGGRITGYESGLLSVGIAYTRRNPSKAHEWKRLDKPVLTPSDADTRWWENDKLYKSTIIRDKSLLTGHKFVMYYNAHGDSIEPQSGAERIGMAVSDNMVHWHRFLEDPVLNHHRGITGDPYIQKIGDIWVMFYCGAFWQPEQRIAFDNFACSRDMVNWTDWEGEKLIEPTEDYDDRYAHKPCVVKWRGVVYHFYCAVNSKDQRGIAVATSVELGRSAK